jgi:hypothetical protein
MLFFYLILQNYLSLFLCIFLLSIWLQYSSDFFNFWHLLQDYGIYFIYELSSFSSYMPGIDQIFESYFQWRSQKFTSGWARDYFWIFGWAQTQKFEDLPINFHLCKRFSKFLGGPVPIRPLFCLRYCLFWFLLIN